jgi:hypothetical protein
MNKLNALLLLLPIVVFPTQMIAQICGPYQPHTDGCSDDIDWIGYGLDVPEILLDGNNGITEFYNSCVSHDYCYQVIGKSQSDCDNSFYVDTVQSCKNKYLKFEAYKIIDYRDVLKTGLYCSALGIPYVCDKWVSEAIWGWVEVSVEFAERTIELPKFPLCMEYANTYYQAVVIGGEPGYDSYQDNATNYAEKLAYNQQNGYCATSTSPQDVNLFASDNSKAASSLYRNILRREPTSGEIIVIADIQATDSEWQYTLINNLTDQRVAILVPITNLILL